MIVKRVRSRDLAGIALFLASDASSLITGQNIFVDGGVTASQLGTWNARNLLTVPEVAVRARVHPQTVHSWIKEGRLEAIQFAPQMVRAREEIGKILHTI